MKGLKFQINQKIEFISEEGQLGTSMVQEWTENFFLVTISLIGHEKTLLPVGDTVTGIYYDTDKNVYMFNSKVLARTVENIPMYKLSMPENVSRIQRRDYVRIPIIIPVRYAEITPEIKSLMEDQKAWAANADKIPWEKATIFDISGGGINLGADRPLEQEKNILIHINREDLQITVQGKVVRKYTRILNDQVTYHHGIKFINMSEPVRDKIIAFIFQKYRQRKT